MKLTAEEVRAVIEYNAQRVRTLASSFVPLHRVKEDQKAFEYYCDRLKKLSEWYSELEADGGFK